MNSKIRNATAAALLVCVTTLGSALSAAEHPSGAACMDIQWNADLLKAFPRAPAACQEVAVRNGKKYARFSAKVTDVGPEAVTVRFLSANGIPERELALKPTPDARVELNGKKVEYSKLQKDDVLTFWVPERQLGVISDPDATASSTIVLN